MNLVQHVKEQRLLARSNGDQNLYATLSNAVGAFDLNRTKKANLTKDQDALMLAELKSEIKRSEEALTYDPSNSDIISSIKVMKGMLPKNLSLHELIEISNQFDNTGDFMKHLKQNHAGLYDGGAAFKLAKELYQ